MKELTYNNTPETMSIEEAVELFQPLEDESIYKSHVLLEKVVPKEYLDSETFFKQIIPTRFAMFYHTLISYASFRLKANEELAMDSIMQNESIDGLSKLYHLPLTEEDKNELDANKQYIITKKRGTDYLLVKSKLLEDKKFIKKVVNNTKDCRGYSRILSELAEYSNEFASSEEYMKEAVSFGDPILYRYYTGENVESVLLKAIETMFERDRFYSCYDKDFYDKQNKDVQKLLDICSKIEDLPRDSKIRKSIYKKICSHYMSKMAENNSNNTITQ